MDFNVSGMTLDSNGDVCVNPIVLFALLGDDRGQLDLQAELSKLGIVRQSDAAATPGPSISGPPEASQAPPHCTLHQISKNAPVM